MIECRELPTYPAGAKYKVQPKAWFSNDIMLEWVEEILPLYVPTPPPGVVPLLYLDSFTVLMMGSVVGAIQALGVEVEFIPPGCTGLVQLWTLDTTRPSRARSRSNTTDGSSSMIPTCRSQQCHAAMWWSGFSPPRRISWWRRAGTRGARRGTRIFQTRGGWKQLHLFVFKLIVNH